MTPTIAELNDVHDIIKVRTDLLEQTFLSPMHLLCLIVSWVSNTWSMTETSSFDGGDEDSKQSLVRELEHFIPRSAPDYVIDNICDFVINDIAHLVYAPLQSILSLHDAMPCTLYAYPALDGVVVITDEEQHETCFEKLYACVRRAP